MMGYLAQQGNFEPKTLKEAMAYGTVAASFTVEDFSLDRLRRINRDDIEHRMRRSTAACSVFEKEENHPQIRRCPQIRTEDFRIEELVGLAPLDPPYGSSGNLSTLESA